MRRGRQSRILLPSSIFLGLRSGTAMSAHFFNPRLHSPNVRQQLLRRPRLMFTATFWYGSCPQPHFGHEQLAPTFLAHEAGSKDFLKVLKTWASVMGISITSTLTSLVHFKQRNIVRSFDIHFFYTTTLLLRSSLSPSLGTLPLKPHNLFSSRSPGVVVGL